MADPRPDRPPTIDELEDALATFRGLRQLLQMRLRSVEQSIELLEQLRGIYTPVERATKRKGARKVRGKKGASAVDLAARARRRGKKSAKKRARKPIADPAKIREAKKAIAKPPKLSGEPGNASDRIRLVLASAPVAGYSIDDVMGACGKKIERQLAMAVLSRLVATGELERVSRGHYRLAGKAA